MPPARLWPLLFPVAYGLHLAEEAWGGPGFVAWAGRHLSEGFTRERFLLINAVAWPAMLAASLAAVFRPSMRWTPVTLAVIVLVNGVLHVASSLATTTYSPGVVTGVLLYLPLGILGLRRAGRETPPATTARAVGLGLALHALVAFVAFGTG